MANTIQLNNDAEWNDDPYAGYYSSDYENYDYGNGAYYDDESLLGDIGGAIKSGVRTVGSILTNPIGTAGKAVSGVGKILGVTTTPASTAGIQNRPGISGSITTTGGKRIPVQLPEAAHKQDIQILQAAVQKINSEIKQVADTTTNNGVALTKLTNEVKTVNEKYATTTKTQNDLIAKLGIGVDKLGKDVKSMRNQEQMNMMMSLLMQPKLESVTFKAQDGSPAILANGTAHEVSESKSTDNTLLMLMMGMMGGDEGGSSGGGMFGDMGSNPLMMILMFKALSGDGSFKL